MARRARDRRPHLTRALAGCLLGAMAVHVGPTTTSQAVNQAAREPLVWVPDRVVPMPGEGVVVVPGHWERPLEPREVHVPSLTVRNPETGASTTLPAGIRPPSDERVGP
jgi:hypothetical protein